MFKIIKKTDPVPLNGISGLVYGQSGIGKTSLGGTAQKSLLLCFENGGLSRADRPGEAAVEIKRWCDIPAPHSDTFKDYDTIVIDTMASAVDACLLSIVGDGKQATIKHFGQLKGAFRLFYDGFNRLGKNVIFLAHASEPSKRQTIGKGEIDLVTPVGGCGSTKDEIYRELHFVAYLERANDPLERVVYFDGGENIFTKNSYGLGAYLFRKGDTDTLDRIISDIRASHNQRQETGLNAQKVMNDLVERATQTITDSTSLEEKKALLEECKTLDSSLVSLATHKINDLIVASLLELAQKVITGEEPVEKEETIRNEANELPDSIAKQAKAQIHKQFTSAGFVFQEGRYSRREAAHVA